MSNLNDDGISAKQLGERLKNGAIGVLPTDTIYGLLGPALNETSVERIYKARKRNPKKPCIILISSLDDLKLFDIRLSSEELQLCAKLWPAKVSIVLPCDVKKFAYLHRGTKTLAFRLPAEPFLIEVLKVSGPLIAPSANLEGEPAAKTAEEAKKYFNGNVDFYFFEGSHPESPSTVIQLKKGKVVLLRQGAVSIPADLMAK